MKIIRKLFLFILLLLLGAALFIFGYYVAVTKGVKLVPEKLVLNEQTITFYDGNEEIVRNASTSFLKQTTSICDVPEYTKRAFIDTEDKRFYSHRGYDIRRIAKATLNNLKSHSFKEGASTISQQLIKNTHLSQEKTFKRKLREWKLTRALEKRYSKEDILEKYLNSIYFGHSCFGIASASEFYFGKTPAELTIADSAILAGLVKSPNNYSPFKNPENCEKRKSVVLSLMLRNESISSAQKAEAVAVSLPQLHATKQSAGYFSFVFDELSALAETYDFKVGGNIEIHTYLDQSAQKLVETIAEEYEDSDKSLLVLDGETRGFKACVSTLGNAKRLPGSLLKPLLVYAPALEENLLSPATPLLDSKVDYGGYSPENYDGQYHGYQSARECVEKSLNVPAVKVLETLTLDRATAYLEKLGLPVLKEDKSLALALGGMKNGYSLRDIMGGYCALQNRGVYESCGFISLVKINGKTLYRKPTEKTVAFSEESAYLMTDILKSTAKKGTAKKLRTLPFEIAAKTGTVGTKKGNTDAYALSYTAKDCVGVWLGNADNQTISTTGGGTPCNLLYKINEGLYTHYKEQGENVPAFPPNKNVRWVELDKPSYYDTHTLLLADDIASPQYRFSELFKISEIPLNKSVSFSNPSISPPTLSLENRTVILTFDEHSPRYYTYKISRYDYATHTTLYQGEYLKEFRDEGLEGGKNYVYTVTPYFEEREGASITLPIVTTKEGKAPQINPPDILHKEWWDY